MYNRYVGNTGRYIRVDERPVERAVVHDHRTPRQNEPGPFHPGEKQKPPPAAGGLLSLLRPLHLKSWNLKLPFGLDAGDLMLLLILFLLYLDSKDEEFLIILAVVGFSLLQNP